MHFQFDYLYNVMTYKTIFCCCRPVYYKTLRLVFSIQNLTRLVTSFLWLQNSIDRLFHRISVKQIALFFIVRETHNQKESIIFFVCKV